MPTSSNVHRPVLHVYLADQCWETTSSLGIYKCARCLLQELSGREDPGFDVVISVSASDEHRMLPFALPDWMHKTVCSNIRGTVHRIWRDQVGSQLLSRRLGADAAFYPKGWIPFLPYRLKTCATLHDTILHHYRDEYPGFWPRLKLWYFLAATSRTLRRADRMFTISGHSRDELSALVPSARERMAVMPLGSTLPSPHLTGSEAREGVLFFSSRFPHKCTAETVARLEAFLKETGSCVPVRVVGELDDVPEGFEVLGRLSEVELSRVLLRTSVVVYLSEIEGFGLPLLESLTHGVAVLHRDAHAFREIMGPDSPGAWDGRVESFTPLLRNLLAMKPEEVLRWRDRVCEPYQWSAAADCFVREMRILLGLSPATDPGESEPAPARV